MSFKITDIVKSGADKSYEGLKKLRENINKSTSGVMKSVSPVAVTLAIMATSVTNAYSAQTDPAMNAYNAKSQTEYSKIIQLEEDKLQLEEDKLIRISDKAVGAQFSIGFLDVPEGSNTNVILSDLENANPETLKKMYGLNDEGVSDIKWAFKKHGKTFHTLLNKINASKIGQEFTMEMASDLMGSAISLDNEWSSKTEISTSKEADDMLQKKVDEFMSNYKIEKIASKNTKSKRISM